jgi:hypothetical protein
MRTKKKKKEEKLRRGTERNQSRLSFPCFFSKKQRRPQRKATSGEKLGTERDEKNIGEEEENRGRTERKTRRQRRTAENEDRGRTRIANCFPCFFSENRDEGK